MRNALRKQSIVRVNLVRNIGCCQARLDTLNREKSPDQEISTDRGTLSIIESWPQNTNYLKIEHFSCLVAAELVFPQLPDVWAALSLLNIFPSRPLTPFTCIAGTP